MPHGTRSWILLLRASESLVYERDGDRIASVHTFDRPRLEGIAAFLDEAQAARRYDALKLIGDPARTRELIARLLPTTRALVADVRSEDLSTIDSVSRRYIVLTVLDLDDNGAHTLREACRVAARESATELHLIHAVVPNLVSDDGMSSRLASQLARVTTQARREVRRSALEITAHIGIGCAAEVTLQAAARLGADLIVLGASPLVERVARDARCSVLVVAPTGVGREPGADCVRTAGRDLELRPAMSPEFT